jgi:hypothetical protein
LTSAQELANCLPVIFDSDGSLRVTDKDIQVFAGCINTPTHVNRFSDNIVIACPWPEIFELGFESGSSDCSGSKRNGETILLDHGVSRMLHPAVIDLCSPCWLQQASCSQRISS